MTAGPGRRDFDAAAATWDENPGRVKLAHEVAAAILAAVQPTGGEDVLDYGCGTGLVTLALAPRVGSVIGVDSSAGMLERLEAKAGALGVSNVRTLRLDLAAGETIPHRVDLVVSSMTLHHVADPLALFRQWRALLRDGGQTAFADLDSEDGSFHGDNTGVHHFGFDREHLGALLSSAGFRSVVATTAARMTRPGADGSLREYEIFLVHART